MRPKVKECLDRINHIADKLTQCVLDIPDPKAVQKDKDTTQAVDKQHLPT